MMCQSYNLEKILQQSILIVCLAISIPTPSQQLFAQTQYPQEFSQPYPCKNYSKKMNTIKLIPKVEIEHYMREGETLSELLYVYGIGTKNALYCLYQPLGNSWLDLTKRLNPFVRNWNNVKPGTKIRLVVPEAMVAKLQKPLLENPDPNLRGPYEEISFSYLRSIRKDAVLVTKANQIALSWSHHLRDLKKIRSRIWGIEIKTLPRVIDESLGEKLELSEQSIFLKGSLSRWNYRNIQIPLELKLGALKATGRFPIIDANQQLQILKTNDKWQSALSAGLGMSLSFNRSFTQVQGALLLGQQNQWKEFQRQSYRWESGLWLPNKSKPRHALASLQLGVDMTKITGDTTEQLLGSRTDQRFTTDFYIPWAGLNLAIIF